MLNASLREGLPNFLWRARVNIFSFAGHFVTITTMQICLCSTKITVANTSTFGVAVFWQNFIYRHWNWNFISFSPVTKYHSSFGLCSTISKCKNHAELTGCTKSESGQDLARGLVVCLTLSSEMTPMSRWVAVTILLTDKFLHRVLV